MSDLQIAGLLLAVATVTMPFALIKWFQRNEKRIEAEARKRAMERVVGRSKAVSDALGKLAAGPQFNHRPLLPDGSIDWDNCCCAWCGEAKRAGAHAPGCVVMFGTAKTGDASK